MSLSVSTWNSSLPIAWRLYLPEAWCQDSERRQQAGVPEEIVFQTKPEIALEQIRQALEQQVPLGVVLADAAVWERHAIPRRPHDTQTAIYGGDRVIDNRLGAGTTTLTCRAAKIRSWRATQTPAAQCRPPACFGKAVGVGAAILSLEEYRLAPRQPEESAFSLASQPAAPRRRPRYRPGPAKPSGGGCITRLEFKFRTRVPGHR